MNPVPFPVPHARSFNAALARRALAPALCALLGLSGCATQRPSASAAVTANAATAQTMHDYRGRFSVRYQDAYRQTRDVYGNFEWHEQDEAITVRLLNPLGQTLAVITSAPATATLELPNKTPQTAANVDMLMQNALGFALPVAGLHYWLRPAPAPGTRARVQTDPATGRVAGIKQDGWTIDYIAYNEPPRNSVKRVDLTRDDPSLEIKLVLDE